MSDGKSPAFVPWEGGTGAADDQVDRAIAETRAYAFPLLGLDPLATRA
jgi:hypothetical protein